MAVQNKPDERYRSTRLKVGKVELAQTIPATSGELK
jgi:hypothetical protein